MRRRYRSPRPPSAGRSIDRWTPRPYTRDELARALLAGRVAGCGHPSARQRRGNARLLLDGDPDKQFGLTGPAGRADARRRPGPRGAPRPARRSTARRAVGAVLIAPEPILDACGRSAERLALAADGGERVRASRPGIPVGARPAVSRARAAWLATNGGRVIKPGRRRSLARAPPRSRLVDRLLWTASAMLTDGARAAPHALAGRDAPDARRGAARPRVRRSRVRRRGDRGRRRDDRRSPT